MTLSSMNHAGVVNTHTHSLGGTIKHIFLTKNWDEINQFLAISEMNMEFKSHLMVFSTCENIGGNLESHRNFWSIIEIFDLGWPQVNSSDLATTFFWKSTLRALFWYLNFLPYEKFEIWPKMTLNLKFDKWPEIFCSNFVVSLIIFRRD